jgi:hypothetical protein
MVRLLLDRGAHPGDTRAPSTETWLSFAFSWTAGPIDRSLRTGAEQTALQIAGERGQHEVARPLSG